MRENNLKGMACEVKARHVGVQTVKGERIMTTISYLFWSLLSSYYTTIKQIIAIAYETRASDNVFKGKISRLQEPFKHDTSLLVIIHHIPSHP